jgi:hypothetical protein
MGWDGLQQIVGPTIVQEKYALSDAPKGSGAELIPVGLALADLIAENRPHFMQREVAVRRVGRVQAKCDSLHELIGPRLRAPAGIRSVQTFSGPWRCSSRMPST